LISGKLLPAAGCWLPSPLNFGIFLIGAGSDFRRL
jgi:hypothetical protein